MNGSLGAWRPCALAFALLAFAAPPAAGDDPAPDVEALRLRVRELEDAKLFLERQVAELRNALHKAYAERGPETHVVTVPLRFDGRAEPPHVKGVNLPPSPTKEQVRAYVARIVREVQHHRGGASNQDPEVGLLRSVGSEHADILMEPLLYDSSPTAEVHLMEALDALVTEKHKALVLERLPLARQLVPIVVSRGWTKDAAPVLLRVLADHASWQLPYPGLPSEWIAAVVSLGRPESHEDLKAYLYLRGNRYDTWSTIKDLPGLGLESDVATLWTWAKGVRDRWERVNVAAVAAHYGHRDALEILFQDATNWPQWQAIERLTPYRGVEGEAGEKSNLRAKLWFEEHRDRIVFDRETKTYRLEK
jgi:hypothetical protein